MNPASLMPGGNPSGNQNLVPTTGLMPTPAIGGQTNPLIPAYPTGSSAPSLPFTANTGGGTGDPNQLLAALSGMNVGADIGTGGPNQSGTYANALRGAFHKAGFSNPLAALIVQFLQGGAGFSPQVAQSMIAALQPQIARGSANIMEQFGAQGLAGSSPAAIGLGDFQSQAVLNEGQILSQLYEQSVQNYMNVLMGGKEPTNQQGGVGSMIGGLLGGAGNLGKGLSSLGINLGGAGASAAGGGSAMGAQAIMDMVATLPMV